MHEMRARGRQPGAAGKRRDQALDDWLGDVSDEDWSEDAARFAEQPRATPVPQERHVPAGSTDRENHAGRSGRPRAVAATEARRAAVERRRAIAALVALLLVALGAGAAVLLLRDGAETVTSVPESTVTTPARTETDPVSTTPSTTPTTTTPTGSSESATTFTLPEGTKLQRGEGVGESDLTVSTDPELVMELQRALAKAGFDPGSPDGTFGQSTEEAVVAFQQANGLSPDGIVGPETADALRSAVAGG